MVFEQPADKLISYKSGQFLTLIVTVDGERSAPAYSLCSSPFVDPDLAVVVKRVDGGRMSNWLPEHLKVGDTVKVMEPMAFNHRIQAKDKKRHLV